MLERERSRFLGSHAIQSATLYEIWRDEYGEEEALIRWSAAQQTPIVPRDYRRYRSSTVEWHHQPRRTSGFRKICRFGELGKMWQTLARELIVAQHVPRSHIGDWPGRGRDRQISALRSAIRSSQQAVVVADVRRCFASVNIDAVYELPFLPEPLIRRAIDHRTQTFVRRERRAYVRAIALAAPTNLEMPPSGLMEGSPASNAIFSVLLDDLPDHVGKEIQVFSYCDNIILLAPSISLARRAERALVRYFTGHRSGPFEVVTEVRAVSASFEHLGYSLTLHPDRGLVLRLSPTNWVKFHGFLERDPVDFLNVHHWLRTSFGLCSASAVEQYGQEMADEEWSRATLAGSGSV